MDSLNQMLFMNINHFAGKNHILDNIILFLGENGPYLFIAIILYIYFMKKQKAEAIYAAFSIILALFFNKILEKFYFHPRPFVDGIGVVLKKHIADSSFPSNHTTFMLAGSCMFLLFENTKSLGKKMLILGIILGLCRVFEGVHYPFDIVGGLVMGFISSIIIFNIRKILEPIINLILKIEKKIFF